MRVRSPRTALGGLGCCSCGVDSDSVSFWGGEFWVFEGVSRLPLRLFGVTVSEREGCGCDRG